MVGLPFELSPGEKLIKTLYRKWRKKVEYPGKRDYNETEKHFKEENIHESNTRDDNR